MSIRAISSLPELYTTDETAWFDRMPELALHGHVEDLDLPHLAEFLSDTARRDRREVESRLVVLLAHLLKWDYRPGRRSTSWRLTVLEQRQELNRHAN